MKTKLHKWMLSLLFIGAGMLSSCSDEMAGFGKGDTSSWLNGSTWQVSGASSDGHQMVLTLGFNGGQVTYQEYDNTAGTSINVYGPFKHSGKSLKFKFIKEWQNQIKNMSIFPKTAELYHDTNNIYNSYIIYNDNKFMFQQDW